MIKKTINNLLVLKVSLNVYDANAACSQTINPRYIDFKIKSLKIFKIRIFSEVICFMESNNKAKR